MSTFDTVLSRARKYRRTGRNSALISCPAAGHEDRHPSVTVTETADGTVLMKCRSRGCDFAPMVAGLGLEMKDFFPARPSTADSYRPPKRITPAADILSALGDELTLSYLIVNDFHDWILSEGQKGIWPDGTTTERLGLALERILAGASEATGRGITAEDHRAYQEAARLTPREEADLEALINA